MAEVTSAEIASLAARALNDPSSLTLEQIQRIAASALTQREPMPEPDIADTIRAFATAIEPHICKNRRTWLRGATEAFIAGRDMPPAIPDKPLWTPIEKAKKDGRDYLLWIGDDKRARNGQCIGRWATWMPEGAQYWQQAGGGEVKPTHFQPLQKGPVDVDDK